MALRAATWIGTIVLLAAFVFASSRVSYEITVITLASGLILLGLVTGAAPPVLDSLLSSKTAVWIGRRSYGLYLWHFIVYRIAWAAYRYFISAYATPGLRMHDVGFNMVEIAAVAASFIVAAASYRFIESPFLRLKSGLAAKRWANIAASTSAVTSGNTVLRNTSNWPSRR